MSLARKAASAAMCAALACASAAGVVGAQALAPTGAGLVQQAGAKYVKKAGVYSFYGPWSRDKGTRKAKLSGNKITVWGKLFFKGGKARSRKQLKSGKRAFRLARNAVVGYYEGVGFKNCSRKWLKTQLESSNFPSFSLRVKGGKVVSVRGSS